MSSVAYLSHGQGRLSACRSDIQHDRAFLQPEQEGDTTKTFVVICVRMHACMYWENTERARVRTFLARGGQGVKVLRRFRRRGASGTEIRENLFFPTVQRGRSGCVCSLRRHRLWYLLGSCRRTHHISKDARLLHRSFSARVGKRSYIYIYIYYIGPLP